MHKIPIDWSILDTIEARELFPLSLASNINGIYYSRIVQVRLGLHYILKKLYTCL